MTTYEDELMEYIRSLREADVRDDAVFHSLLARGFDILHLMDKDVAREFGVSRPSVTRWRNGVNAPHPAMRKPVYTFLDQRAHAVLRRLPRETAPVKSRHSDSSPVIAMAAMSARRSD
jgi:hypothetical protein